MFAQCVIAAQLIEIGNGVKCGGAMVRDASAYSFSIFIVMVAFAVGTINRAFIAVAVAIYAVYVVWVFVGDEWHAHGRPDVQTSLTKVQSSISNIKDALIIRFVLYHDVESLSHPAPAMSDYHMKQGFP